MDVQAEFQKLTFDTIARITIGAFGENLVASVVLMGLGTGIDLHTQTEKAESDFGRAWRVILEFLHFRFFCPFADTGPEPPANAWKVCVPT